MAITPFIIHPARTNNLSVEILLQLYEVTKIVEYGVFYHLAKLCSYMFIIPFSVIFLSEVVQLAASAFSSCK